MTDRHIYPAYGHSLIPRSPELVCWDCEQVHPMTLASSTPEDESFDKGFRESLDLFKWIHANCKGKNYD